MKGKVIKYIGHYNTPDASALRDSFVSATSKMDYIINVLNESGYKVNILSLSQCVEKKFCIVKGGKQIIREGVSLCLLPSFGGASRYLCRMRFIWIYISTFLMCLFKIRRHDTVILYHANGVTDSIIDFYHKIVPFKLVLEVEEIYEDATKIKNSFFSKIERKSLSTAEAYIFSNDLLNEKTNNNKKPFVVCYGPYIISDVKSRHNRGLINVIYAGTFDRIKGGVENAVKCAKFLPENYCVNICGFGLKEDIEYIQGLIDENNRIYPSKVVYHGLKKGNEYVTLLQSCDIGLSTQDPNMPFNDTSFPSKILTYMSNGLEVVTTNVQVVKKSAISNYMHYSSGIDPCSLANAIRDVDFTSNDNVQVIRSLSKDFSIQFVSLLSSI